MRVERAGLLIVVLLALVGATWITVKSKDLKQVTVRYKSRNERVYCYKSTAGMVKTSGSTKRFISYSSALSSVNRSKERSKYDKYKALASLGKVACRKPAAAPTPAPTPIPTGNFDLQGNVTSAGRALFGIPNGLAANISAGRSLYQTKCTGCHIERTNYTFLVVREAIKASPMLFDEAQVPDGDLANIIAYLNRFRP